MIYDLTQINNELDLLEIRLNILDPYVDFFVIGESTQTFSGKEKPLYFKENKERFKQWMEKIIYIKLPPVEGVEVFERTALQKDYLRNALQTCEPDDVIYYGDVDEIWTPQEVGEEIYKLEQLNYCYYLNMRSTELWQGTNVCKYENLVNLNELRANHDHVLEDGGWHFTNQGGYEQILNKLESYDHQEMVNDDVKAKLKERMENGEDYLGRNRDWKGRPFEFYLDESQLPRYVQNNKEKWLHLLK